MTFDRINRRIHLYVGLLLAPWFLLYAISGFVFNHPALFQQNPNAAQPWVKLFEHRYRLPPVTDENEDALAQTVLRDHGLAGRYRTDFDEADNFVVYRMKFLSTIRLTYYAKESRIRSDEQRLRLGQFLTSAHARSGFEYPYFLEFLWAVMVDLTALAIFAWIGSGLYLWWQLKRFRLWVGFRSRAALLRL